MFSWLGGVGGGRGGESEDVPSGPSMERARPKGRNSLSSRHLRIVDRPSIEPRDESPIGDVHHNRASTASSSR